MLEASRDKPLGTFGDYRRFVTPAGDNPMISKKKGYDGFISFGLLVATIAVSVGLTVPPASSPYVIFFPIVFFAFTIGFAISGLRQSGTANHIFAAFSIGISMILMACLLLP